MASRFTAILHPDYTLHLTGKGHPELPGRYVIIAHALSAEGLATREHTIVPTPASEETITLCHTSDYIATLKCEVANARMLNLLEGQYTLSTGDVQICPESYSIAQLAVGGATAAVDAVLSGAFLTAFACVRPPGHHATADRGMGFCLLNNVAIAARYAQRSYGLKRVLIVDWDVHHGNGTQEIFYNDPSVYYFSTHQQGIYPGTGMPEQCGKGNIFNCPIAGGSMSRLAVIDAHTRRLAEVAALCQPELILISAGFDAHVDDPLGGFNLSDDDFAVLTALVMDLAATYCQGRVASILEGGYNLHALASSAVAHCRTLAL
jgi:acetoin utilization deacetylase AcuC-like enzyme